MGKLGTVHWKKFEKFLLSKGCEFKSQKSSHRKYHKPGLLRPIIVPERKDIPPFVILNNLRTLSVEKEEYLKFLKSNK